MSAADDPGEGKSQNIWSLLPSFDPSSDSAREYIEKVKFIDGICPKKDRSMLAPRLAMLCRGTAWGQVKSLPAASLVDETNGVKNLLAALSTWEESSEMRTFELFERAIYKTTQRPDESSLSFVNRLQVAFNELGSTTIDEMRAFLLLRQSALTSEDKKKVLTTWRCWEPKIFGRSQKPKKKVGKPILWMCIMETFVFAFFTPYKLHCAISVYKHKTTYNIF